MPNGYTIQTVNRIHSAIKQGYTRWMQIPLDLVTSLSDLTQASSKWTLETALIIMDCDVKKPVFGICDQVRLKPAC